MRTLFFRFGVIPIIVEVNGRNIAINFNGRKYPLEYIFELNTREQLVHEFPDLEKYSIKEIKKIAMERIQEKIRTMKSEIDLEEWVRQEFKTQGWTYIKTKDG